MARRRAPNERLRKRTRQLALANQLGTRLAAMTDVDEIVDAAVEELHRAFGFYSVVVVQLQPDGIVARSPAAARRSSV